MEYNWLVIIPSFSFMAMFILNLYFKIGTTGLVISETVNLVQDLPKEIIHDKHTLLEHLKDQYDLIAGYLKDSVAAVFLIITTIIVKALGYDVVWAPFWGSVFYCGYLLQHFVSLNNILNQTKHTAESVHQLLLVNVAMHSLARTGLQSNNIPQPDLNLTNDNEFDIEG